MRGPGRRAEWSEVVQVVQERSEPLLLQDELELMVNQTQREQRCEQPKAQV